jgi:hypothetical protein
MGAVSLGVILLIVVIVDVAAVAALLALSRRARGGFLGESAHPGAVLQVAGTIYAVMVGFVFLIAFQSYNKARSAAQAEATATESLAAAAGLLPAEARFELQGDLVCYARSVIHQEWPLMGEGKGPSPITDGWAAHAGNDFAAIKPRSLINGAAGQQWLERSDARQLAREERLAESDALVPRVVWALLLIGGLAVLVFVLVLSAGRDRRLTRTVMVVAVATLISSSLLTIEFLDRTFGDHRGAISPMAMRSALTLIERERARGAVGALPPPPCDELGRRPQDAV